MLGVSGAPVAVPMPAQNAPQSHSKIAIPEARNQQFGAEISNLGGSGGPEGAWAWSWVLLGSPGGSWRAAGGLPGASRGAPGSLPGGSRASRGGLGGDLGRSREALGALLGGSRGVLGGSREVLGASWEGSREVLSIPGAPRPPRRPMLDRFGADLGSNLGPGTYENSVFSEGFCGFS